MIDTNELAQVFNQASWAWSDLINQKKDWTIRQRPRTVTASANVNPLDDLIRVSGTATMTLETAVGCDGRQHTFKLVSAGTMTIACTGGQTIDGAATFATSTLYESLAVKSNGANWEVVSKDAFVSIFSGLSRFKVGTFTRVMSVASGSVAYTGVGFQPKAILLFGNVVNVAVNASSKGFDDGTTRFLLLDFTKTGADAGFGTVAASIYLFDDVATVNVNSATVASFDADGFTLAWVKTNTPTSTANCAYLAFR